jgi:hypothetical protein
MYGNRAAVNLVCDESFTVTPNEAISSFPVTSVAPACDAVFGDTNKYSFVRTHNGRIHKLTFRLLDLIGYDVEIAVGTPQAVLRLRSATSVALKEDEAIEGPFLTAKHRKRRSDHVV